LICLTTALTRQTCFHLPRVVRGGGLCRTESPNLTTQDRGPPEPMKAGRNDYAPQSPIGAECTDFRYHSAGRAVCGTQIARQAERKIAIVATLRHPST